jgi:hypothetical protein
VSNLTIIICFLPLLLLWWKKLSGEKTYLFIAIYWLANGILNLPDFFSQSQGIKNLQIQLILLYNLLDAPLALLIFYFAAKGKKKQGLLYILLSFVLFELVSVILKGHNLISSTIIIGPGSILALIYSVWGIAEYFQKIEHTPYENVMGFVYAGFLFDYGMSIVTYVFNYLDLAKDSKQTLPASLFIYYFSLILAGLLTSFGLWRHARPSGWKEA